MPGASAVLHLHDTQWLPPSLSSSDVLFLPTTSSGIPPRPFVHTQLPDSEATPIPIEADDCEDDDLDPDDLLPHQCATLVTLAIMLMEVYFAAPFRDLARRPCFKACRDEIPEYSPFRYALEKCLDPATWEDENSHKLDQQTLRMRIYQEIVQLLEVELRQAYSYIPIDDLDRFAQNLNFASWDQSIQGLNRQIQAENLHQFIDSRQGVFSQPNMTPSLVQSPYTHSQPLAHLPSPIPSAFFWIPWVDSERRDIEVEPESIYIEPKVFTLNQKAVFMPSQCEVAYHRDARFFEDEALPETIDEARHSYNKWRSQYDAVYHEFVPEDFKVSPVRIGILDTGLDTTHPHVEARMDSIKGKLNWHSDKHPTAVHDRNGHGTFVTGLLMNYAPHGEFFISKIAENKPSSPRIIANAINYAVSLWRVDMISMSFGFPTCAVEGYDELEKALKNANMNNVLLFAAASNSGGRLDLTYPAREDGVIAVYSTDTNGNRSAFSPTAASQGVSLATVGEAIESAWPVHLCDEEQNPIFISYKSGTSYATPIMTGIAAFLLLYVRVHIPEKAESIKKLRRMREVLVRVAEKGASRGRKLRDGYYFVDLSLYNDCLFGKEKGYIDSLLSDSLTN
ncbi:peptidase S8/S53 domain-containing protein [Podospora fimiseda]|uniref:Peptidase S8/S53 domain-containing protein n=1 Tax=Podospora fimiseda TaxID=252190 RepID=A0AAN6YL54_9PEZI|nr:peptidase S8/S53 domain-containing protein [Podospora fimiseda]